MSVIKTNLIAVTAFAIFTAQCAPPANALPQEPARGGVIRLANDHGGLMKAYEDRFVQARENGERVVIDGICLSACTLAVGISYVIENGRIVVMTVFLPDYRQPNPNIVDANGIGVGSTESDIRR
jgi:hypothetical protein